MWAWEMLLEVCNQSVYVIISLQPDEMVHVIISIEPVQMTVWENSRDMQA